MAVDKEAILRVHASCCNAQDLDCLMGHYTPQSRAIKDGRLVGEGPEAVRQAISAEFSGLNLVGRVMRLDGEPVLVGWDREGMGEPRAILSFTARDDRVSEVRIEHGEVVRRVRQQEVV